MSTSDCIQLAIAVFTAAAALSAAYSAHLNKKDREMQYKPQFEIITDESNNVELNVANLNPNYQSYDVLGVINKTSSKSLDFNKQLTMLNNGLNVLQIQFKESDRVHSENNVIQIKSKSIIGKVYEEEVVLYVDKDYKISHDIKGLSFK